MKRSACAAREVAACRRVDVFLIKSAPAVLTRRRCRLDFFASSTFFGKRLLTVTDCYGLLRTIYGQLSGRASVIVRNRPLPSVKVRSVFRFYLQHRNNEDILKKVTCTAQRKAVRTITEIGTCLNSRISKLAENREKIL